MENVFNPLRHRVVAVVASPADPDYGQHVHVSLGELAGDLAQVAEPIRIPDAPPPINDLTALQAGIDELRLAVSDLSRGWDAQQEIVSRHIVEELRKLPDPSEVEARLCAIEERALSAEELAASKAATIEQRLAILERKLLKPVIDLGPVLERLDALEAVAGLSQGGGDIEARITAIERRFEEADDPIPAFLGGSSGPSPSEEMERALQFMSERVRALEAELAEMRKRPDFSAHVVRYDLALRARNGNVEAMALLSPEAEWLGVSVGEFADQIISERTKIEQLVMRGGK